jgi:hypothetical protein
LLGAIENVFKIRAAKLASPNRGQADFGWIVQQVHDQQAQATPGVT